MHKSLYDKRMFSLNGNQWRRSFYSELFVCVETAHHIINWQATCLLIFKRKENINCKCYTLPFQVNEFWLVLQVSALRRPWFYRYFSGKNIQNIQAYKIYAIFHLLFIIRICESMPGSWMNYSLESAIFSEFLKWLCKRVWINLWFCLNQISNWELTHWIVCSSFSIHNTISGYFRSLRTKTVLDKVDIYGQSFETKPAK